MKQIHNFLALESCIYLENNKSEVEESKKEDVCLLQSSARVQHCDLKASVQENAVNCNGGQKVKAPEEKTIKSCDHFWTFCPFVPLVWMKRKPAGDEVALL